MVDMNAKKGLKLPITADGEVENDSMFVDSSTGDLKFKDDEGNTGIVGGVTPGEFDSATESIVENSMQITRLSYEASISDIPHDSMVVDYISGATGKNSTIIQKPDLPTPASPTFDDACLTDVPVALVDTGVNQYPWSFPNVSCGIKTTNSSNSYACGYCSCHASYQCQTIDMTGLDVLSVRMAWDGCVCNHNTQCYASASATVRFNDNANSGAGYISVNSVNCLCCCSGTFCLDIVRAGPGCFYMYQNGVQTGCATRQMLDVCNEQISLYFTSSAYSINSAPSFGCMNMCVTCIGTCADWTADNVEPYTDACYYNLSYTNVRDNTGTYGGACCCGQVYAQYCIDTNYVCTDFCGGDQPLCIMEEQCDSYSDGRSIGAHFFVRSDVDGPGYTCIHHEDCKTFSQCIDLSQYQIYCFCQLIYPNAYTNCYADGPANFGAFQCWCNSNYSDCHTSGNYSYMRYCMSRVGIPPYTPGQNIWSVNWWCCCPSIGSGQFYICDDSLQICGYVCMCAQTCFCRSGCRACGVSLCMDKVWSRAFNPEVNIVLCGSDTSFASAVQSLFLDTNFTQAGTTSCLLVDVYDTSWNNIGCDIAWRAMTELDNKTHCDLRMIMKLCNTAQGITSFNSYGMAMDTL